MCMLGGLDAEEQIHGQVIGQHLAIHQLVLRVARIRGTVEKDGDVRRILQHGQFGGSRVGVDLRDESI